MEWKIIVRLLEFDLILFIFYIRCIMIYDIGNIKK